MNREKELIKNTVILGIGKVLPKFIAIITLPIITAKLTKNEYGTYDFISTLVMLLLPIATLQIQSSAFRFLIDCRGDKEKSSSIITNIFAVTISISAIVSVGLIFFWQGLSITTRFLIGIYFFVDIVYIAISQISRGLGLNKNFSVSSIIISVTNAIGIVLTVQLNNHGLNGVIFSLVLANIFAVFYLILKTHIWQYISIVLISKKTIKELLSYSWPMIPNNLSNWVLRVSDRVVITGILGTEANATYAVANKIPSLLGIAQSIFVMAWQENASVAVKDKDADKYYTEIFNKVLGIMFGCTALLIGFTPIIFELLIKGDYDDAYAQMPILILGMFFYCMAAFLGGIYIAHKKTKSVGMTTIFSAICNFVINITLINFIGITAASVATLVSYFLLYLFRMIDTIKFQKMKYNVKKQIIFLVIISIMLALCFLRNYWLNIINIILGCIIFIIANKDLIFQLIKEVQKKYKSTK